MALRIKKEIDLKELEKFGFKLMWNMFTGDFDYAQKDIVMGIPRHSYRLKVNSERKLRLVLNTNYALNGWSSEIDEFLLDSIYDLIKADMVEKVEE